MFWDVTMTECHVQPFRNILMTECSKHFGDRMFGRPRFPPGGAAEPTGAPGLPVSIRGGPTTPPRNTSRPPYRPAGHRCPKGSPERHGGPKGFGRRGPLVQLCVVVISVSRPCGRSGSRRCAVWTLAAWRCLILHARLGLRRSAVEWSAIHRVPAPHLFPASSGAPCALTPRG